jgi:hypothetical protein
MRRRHKWAKDTFQPGFLTSSMYTPISAATAGVTPVEKAIAMLIDDKIVRIHRSYFQSNIQAILLSLSEICDRCKSGTAGDVPSD